MPDVRTRKRPTAYRPVRAMTEIPDDLPVLLEVRTAAEVAGFSEKFVRDLLRAGKVRGVKIGGAWRVHRDAYLEQLGLV